MPGLPAVEDHVGARLHRGFLRTRLDQHLSDSDRRYASFVRQGYK